MAKILFKMSGSIAGFKACAAISQLVKQGHEVQTVITSDVLNFIGKSTLEGLTGKKVLHDLHEEGHMMSHIHLNTWADITVLCPASANTIARMAHGEASNLVLSLALARQVEKPYLIFPAMNPKMWSAGPTQNNIKALKNYGYKVFMGTEGQVACGDYGVGRLAEPDVICQAIKEELMPMTNKKILITAGGTTESIDAVRNVSNASTGKTGAFLAHELLKTNHITFIGTKEAHEELKRLVPSDLTSLPQLEIKIYKSFQDLKSLMTETLKFQKFDTVIHCAAVSDFSPEKVIIGGKEYSCPVEEKIPTDENMQVIFRKNPKLIQHIRKDSRNKDVKVIGFKLLKDRNDPTINENIDRILQSSDYVVLNFLNEINDNAHPFEVYSRMHGPILGESKSDMANVIKTFINEDGEGPSPDTEAFV